MVGCPGALTDYDIASGASDAATAMRRGANGQVLETLKRLNLSSPFRIESRGPHYGEFKPSVPEQ
jgi:hypothetical protein